MITEILLGTGVGLALGLTGSGGVLAVPALMLGLGFTLPEAMPVSLISVGISSFLGSIDGLRQGLVRYRAAIVMAISGTLIAPLGIAASHVLPANILTSIFSILLLMVAIKMARQALQHYREQQGGVAHPLEFNCMLRPDTGRFEWNPKCFFTLSSIGGLSGFSSGLLGVGGGFLIVPGIRQFSNLNMHSIVATSLAVITLISTGTVIAALFHGAQLTPQAWWFIGATCVGMVAGRKSAPLLSGQLLTLGFALLTSVVSMALLYKYMLPNFWS